MAKKSAKSARNAKSAKSAKSARGSARSTKSAKSTRSAKSTKSAKSTRGAAKKSAKSSKSRSGGGRGRTNAAFMAPVTPSPELAEVVGDRPMPRTEITKRLWDYIKKNGLQDQKNRRMIKADGALKPVFGGKAQVNMFEMTSLVNKHLG
jgi:upstream activation factor subunit UAF30